MLLSGFVQDSILALFLCNFFSICFISIHVVYPYSSVDTATAWKKSHFILSDQSDFYMINNMSIAFLPFSRHILTSLLVDEMLLLRCVNSVLILEAYYLEWRWFLFIYSIHVLCFICIHVETNTSSCLHQAVQ